MTSLTLSGWVQLIEPLKDIGDHECCCPRGAVLSGDVSLLSEARSHVVHNRYNNAHGLLGHRDALGQLQLWCTTDQIHMIQRMQQVCVFWFCGTKGALLTLTKKSILDLSTTAMVPGGAIGGALGGMVRQNWTFHLSCAAWSGNCRGGDEHV